MDELREDPLFEDLTGPTEADDGPSSSDSSSMFDSDGSGVSRRTFIQGSVATGAAAGAPTVSGRRTGRARAVGAASGR